MTAFCSSQRTGRPREGFIVQLDPNAKCKFTERAEQFGERPPKPTWDVTQP